MRKTHCVGINKLILWFTSKPCRQFTVYNKAVPIKTSQTHITRQIKAQYCIMWCYCVVRHRNDISEMFPDFNNTFHRLFRPSATQIQAVQASHNALDEIVIYYIFITK